MPKPAITRVSNLEITPSSTNKEKGFYTAPITTAQRDAMTQADGSIIYNTTTKSFQGRQNGGWTNIATQGGNVALTAPTFATANAPAVANGNIYFDSNTNALTTGVNGAYVSVYTSPLAQTGNLVMKSLAADPANGSSVNGEVYYNTGVNVIRARINGVWNTVNTSDQAATGIGLASGTAFTLPRGDDTAEVAGNEVVGFMFYNTTTSSIRTYTGAGWKTVTVA